MPRYTFIIDCDKFPTEADLRDDDAAWIEALHLAGEMMRDAHDDLPSKHRWGISVTNEGGQPVATVSIQAQRHRRVD